MVHISYLMNYIPGMTRILESETFKNWCSKLKDRVAVARITARVKRLSNGHFGDCRYLRDSVRELRIDYGPGYRVYFTLRGDSLILLLAGGDQSTQEADIDPSIQLADMWRTET